MTGLWIALSVLGVVIILVLILVGMYNRLVSMREQVRNAWAQIDVLLKRRVDLIPNLVETVKGYASHERGTLEAVMAARAGAVSAASGSPEQRVAAEGQLSGAVRQLFAVAEAYPNLKADANFQQLMGELSNTENGISQQRGGYNSVVQQYNTTVMSVPTNFIAGPFGFTTQPFFEVTDAAERAAPSVKF